MLEIESNIVQLEKHRKELVREYNRIVEAKYRRVPIHFNSHFRWIVQRLEHLHEQIERQKRQKELVKNMIINMENRVKNMGAITA